MIATSIDLEPVLAIEAELGEGPVWDPRTACLYFVDILRGHVHRFAPATGSLRTYHVNQSVGAVALAEADDLVLAVSTGFARLNLETGRVRMIAEVEADRSDHRMNDGNCDPAGRFWAGTMALDARPGAGALYRLEPDGRVETILRNVTISNGIDWSADGTRMFFIDSPTQAIDVFDVDPASGAIANRRPFVRIAGELGLPDGLTIDADEHVWVALWGGSAVHRYAPDGSLDGVMRLPASRPTSCAFGGVDLRDLYITTATIELTPSERAAEPRAGALFRCRPGPAGRPARRFRG
jgi:sugar lactone lactonase YvrE